MTTQAERASQAPDPYREAVANCAYTSKPDPERKVFVFEDRSTLEFRVLYEVDKTGVLDD